MQVYSDGSYGGGAGGDWMMFPVTGVDGEDVTVQPETDNPVVLEYVMFYQV